MSTSPEGEHVGEPIRGGGGFGAHIWFYLNESTAGLHSLLREGNVMKRLIALISMLGVALICGAATILTSDPLTRLPLDPASNSRLNLGNAPTAMHPSMVCKSNMQANLYTVYASVNETNAWYMAHLKDLKHAHGYSNGRSRDAFYNSGGTMVVTVTGEPAKDGQNVDTHAVVYYTFQPGVSERTILAMLNEKIVC